MSVYPTNQNRHFYVVTGCVNGASPATTVSAAIGNIELKAIGNGKNKELYFLYNGANGRVIKSDYIQVKNLDYVKAVDAKTMRVPLKKIRVGLAPDLDLSNIESGEEFVIRITFRQFHGMSDEDIYIKDAAVALTSAIINAKANASSPYYSNTEPSLAENTDKKAQLGAFYRALAKALKLSFSREVGATKESNPYLDIQGDCTGLYLWEKPQDWTQGIGKQERVYFDVMPTTIFYNGTDFEWGIVEDKTLTSSEVASAQAYQIGYNTTDNQVSRAMPNGRTIADLEWFCLGERGDQYRWVGWPDYITTYYQVNPNAEYHVLEIHHAFTDTGVNSYRGEKDITIVSTSKDAINALVSAIISETDLTENDIPSLT